MSKEKKDFIVGLQFFVINTSNVLLSGSIMQLFIIFLIGGLSISIHVLDGFQYPLEVTLSFVLACIAGMLIGRRIITLIPVKTVQKIFATTVTVVAAYLIFSALSA